MEFFLLGLTLWLFIIVSLIFMVKGFQKKSSPMVFVSIVGYLVPMAIFTMYEQYFIAFALLAIIPFVAAFQMKR